MDTLLLTLYGLYLIGATIFVVSENRDPQAMLASGSEPGRCTCRDTHDAANPL